MNDILQKYSDEAAEAIRAIIKDAANDTGNGDFEVIATTDGTDRDGEIIKSDAWELEPYTKNPVLLWAHNYSIPPIGIVQSFTKKGNAWVAKGIFAKTEFAQQIRQLYDDGILKAVSVGFIPKERQGNVITKAELLELSFVPVPANSEAITLRRMADMQELVTKMLGKGQIADNIAAREASTEQDWAGKFDFLEDCGEAYWSFVDIIQRPETSIEQVPELIKELAELISKIAAGDEVTEEGDIAKNMATDEDKERIKEIAGKSGRVLSSKNRDKIQGAVNAISDVNTALAELLDLTDTEKEAEVVVEKSNLEDLQMIARIVDKSLEGLSRSIKQNLKV